MAGKERKAALCNSCKDLGSQGIRDHSWSLSMNTCLQMYWVEEAQLWSTRPWGFSPEARRGSQGASRAAPGLSITNSWSSLPNAGTEAPRRMEVWGTALPAAWEGRRARASLTLLP